MLWSRPADITGGRILLILIVSEDSRMLETKNSQTKTFSPSCNPVTKVSGLFSSSIEPEPEIRLQTPFPETGIFPEKLAESSQTVLSSPASAGGFPLTSACKMLIWKKYKTRANSVTFLITAVLMNKR